MRTVDPELWLRKVKRPHIQVARPMRFGQQAGCAPETRLRDSLRDALREYWTHSSLGAAKFLNIERKNTYEKWYHILLFLVTLSLGVGIVLYNHVQVLSRPPLIVSLQSDDNSISDYKFPAVALCSNNVISKAALKNYTKYLYKHPKNKAYRYRASDIEHNLLDLGALLTLALPPISVDFERFMRDVEPHFNITDIMFRLSVNCSEILIRCSWRGELVECDKLFASRLTALGFCCVFNSRYQPDDYDREPAVLDLIGQDYGLGVVIKEPDDFAYVRRPAYGMEMLLFQGDEFPLLESGDVRMYPMPRNASLYFNIRAYSQYPASEIRYYTEERRSCRLEGVGMSQCLWECRRETAVALCGCAPYALQPHSVPHAVPTCTISELACLNKHREKFMYLFPGENAGPALSQELQDALDCSHCLVKCQRQLFSASIFYSFYKSKSHNIFRNFLSADLSLVNTTVIRLFYSVNHHEWYKLEAYTRWFEAIIRISTQWVVVTGVTILSYTELVYHCTFRWLHHFIRRTRIANMQPLETST